MARRADLRADVHELEEHLGHLLFDDDGTARAQAALRLVRSALDDDDRIRARCLADATRRLSERRPGDADVAAAAVHARGLVDRDTARLEAAARTYSALWGKAQASEDAGQASSGRGDTGAAVVSLRRAYELYERQECAEGMARVRSQLRIAGVHLHHWRRAERPAFGWASLTDTERRIADLVSQGLSNREVAERVYLSSHTVAFHLRHIFDKLGIGSRVQLARLVAQQADAP